MALKKEIVEMLVESVEHPENVIKMTQEEADNMTDKCLAEALKATKSGMVKSTI